MYKRLRPDSSYADFVMNRYDGENWYMHFRMTKDTFLRLHDLLYDYIYTKPSNFNPGVPVV